MRELVGHLWIAGQMINYTVQPSVVYHDKLELVSVMPYIIVVQFCIVTGDTILGQDLLYGIFPGNNNSITILDPIKFFFTVISTRRKNKN